MASSVTTTTTTTPSSPSGSGVVGGQAFYDSDDDGAAPFDVNGFPNVNVWLFSCSDNLPSHSSRPLMHYGTASNGIYRFANLPPGSYYVVAQPPGGYRFSSVMPASARNNDDVNVVEESGSRDDGHIDNVQQSESRVMESTIDPESERTACFELREGEKTMDWSFGLYGLTSTTDEPSVRPSSAPSDGPVLSIGSNNGPSGAPPSSLMPSLSQSTTPTTAEPSSHPTPRPSLGRTTRPTSRPSSTPTPEPSSMPSTSTPTLFPSDILSFVPSNTDEPGVEGLVAVHPTYGGPTTPHPAALGSADTPSPFLPFDLGSQASRDDPDASNSIASGDPVRGPTKPAAPVVANSPSFPRPASHGGGATQKEEDDVVRLASAPSSSRNAPAARPSSFGDDDEGENSTPSDGGQRGTGTEARVGIALAFLGIILAAIAALFVRKRRRRRRTDKGSVIEIGEGSSSSSLSSSPMRRTFEERYRVMDLRGEEGHCVLNDNDDGGSRGSFDIEAGKSEERSLASGTDASFPVDGGGASEDDDADVRNDLEAGALLPRVGTYATRRRENDGETRREERRAEEEVEERVGDDPDALLRRGRIVVERNPPPASPPAPAPAPTAPTKSASANNVVLLHIDAPPGNLGLVLDASSVPPSSSSDGALGPVRVRGLHPFSPLRDRVRLNDRIVAVDGEDVTGLDPVQVGERLSDNKKKKSGKKEKGSGGGGGAKRNRRIISIAREERGEGDEASSATGAGAASCCSDDRTAPRSNVGRHGRRERRAAPSNRVVADLGADTAPFVAPREEKENSRCDRDPEEAVVVDHVPAVWAEVSLSESDRTASSSKSAQLNGSQHIEDVPHPRPSNNASDSLDNDCRRDDAKPRDASNPAATRTTDQGEAPVPETTASSHDVIYRSVAGNEMSCRDDRAQEATATSPPAPAPAPEATSPSPEGEERDGTGRVRDDVEERKAASHASSEAMAMSSAAPAAVVVPLHGSVGPVPVEGEGSEIKEKVTGASPAPEVTPSVLVACRPETDGMNRAGKNIIVVDCDEVKAKETSCEFLSGSSNAIALEIDMTTAASASTKSKARKIEAPTARNASHSKCGSRCRLENDDDPSAKSESKAAYVPGTPSFARSAPQLGDTAWVRSEEKHTKEHGEPFEKAYHRSGKVRDLAAVNFEQKATSSAPQTASFARSASQLGGVGASFRDEEEYINEHREEFEEGAASWYAEMIANISKITSHSSSSPRRIRNEEVKEGTTAFPAPGATLLLPSALGAFPRPEAGAPIRDKEESDGTHRCNEVEEKAVSSAPEITPSEDVTGQPDITAPTRVEEILLGMNFDETERIETPHESLVSLSNVAVTETDRNKAANASTKSKAKKNEALTPHPDLGFW